VLTKRTADIAVATILLAIGIAMCVGGYTMDRLEHRRIHPASFPGLVPMILGAVMAAMSLMLILGQIRAPRPAGTSGDFTRDELVRLAAVGGLCLFYALVLVGNVHFWLASSLFVGTFTALFEPGEARTPRARAIRFAAIAVFAVVLGWAISTLFETGFLVRLP
jgi:putative tricarboxylic transport membrane protein